MPERTEEEILALIHEFDDRVREMEKILYEVLHEDVFQDSMTNSLVRCYWANLFLLKEKYDFIDKRQSILAQLGES